MFIVEERETFGIGIIVIRAHNSLEGIIT